MKNLKRIIKKYKLDGLKVILINKFSNKSKLEGGYDPNRNEIIIYLKNCSNEREVLAHELTHKIMYKRSKGKIYLNHTWQFYNLMSQILKELK